MAHPFNRKTQAFSLIELSIVLVILGLLAGGVLSGQSLIRASELRSVTADYSRYVTAVGSFRDKYFALPGDMNNATAFWTAADADATTCKTTIVAGSPKATCNGNGNGRTGDWVVTTERYEMFRFWQQLANAGLVEGSYTGVSANGVVDSGLTRIGSNTPASKIASVGWSVSHLTNYVGDAGFFALDYGNHLIVGGQHATEYTTAGAFKPEEVWNIDTKLDDGKPAYGSVVAIRWDDCTAAANNADINTSYALTNSDRACAIAFTKAF